ncbi:ribbon-helix-helix protein, CopG family [Sulfurimonas sp.]|uniref:ribbon-helix-helix protein, CopG family n=1 Tax=Sulfurimonas sp. TaxID=2022749 RepID=UPI0025E3194C|nr:ribbon-helix-helix protein, CopG family [Sulfurimonas sp.]MCK9473356.1 ribbon-helix-helix protein, CopG family [Sulfurimonas sp.]
MKTFSITVEDELYAILNKDSASHQVSKSEIVRRRLTEAYHSQAKQEEKVVKAFDDFKVNISKILEERFEKIDAQNVRSLIYILTNHHLLKLILKDAVFTELDIEEQAKKIREYVSLAKGLGLKVHPVDSFHSKENLADNIFPEHLS